MKKIKLNNRFLLILLIAVAVLVGGCIQQKSMKEMTISKYIPITEAFEYFPEDIKTTPPIASCETIIKAAKNDEEVRMGKIACFEHIYVYLISLNKICDNNEALKVQIENIARNAEQEALLNCPASNVECKIREVADALREVVGVYEENVDNCINDINYPDKNKTKTEMLNYLKWLKEVITEVEES
jgi:hypothetical protein